MAKIFRTYLNEGLPELGRMLDDFAAHAKNLKASVDYMKKGSFKTACLQGYPTVFAIAGENLSVIRQDIRRLSDLPDEFFSASWRSMTSKFADVEKTLSKVSTQPAKVINDRAAQHLATEWVNWAMDYQDLVELYIEAVHDFEEHIEELY